MVHTEVNAFQDLDVIKLYARQDRISDPSCCGQALVHKELCAVATPGSEHYD